jgi:hypothetical protein
MPYVRERLLKRNARRPGRANDGGGVGDDQAHDAVRTGEHLRGLHRKWFMSPTAPFGQVPAMDVDGVMIAQSAAICTLSSPVFLRVHLHACAARLALTRHVAGSDIRGQGQRVLPRGPTGGCPG